jgi:hypothetical protein
MHWVSTKILVLLGAILWSPMSWATAYVSAQTGNWNSSSTWTPSGVPGVGDTASISNTHTVTITSTASVGTSPSNTTTYVLTVNAGGVLKFEDNAASDRTLSVYGNININGGTIYMGTAANPVPCSRRYKMQIFQFGGSYTYSYRIYYASAASKFEIHGCEGFPAWNGSTSLSTITRARITECDQNPCTGAVTLTLDQSPNWQVNSTGLSSGSILVGVGGGTTDPGSNTHELVNATSFPAPNQVSLTLSQTHQVGDIVANLARNAIVTGGNSSNQQPYLYRLSALAPTTSFDTAAYPFRWARFDHVGDSIYGTLYFSGSGAVYSVDLDNVAMSYCGENGGNGSCLQLSHTQGYYDLDNSIFHNDGTDRVLDLTPPSQVSFWPDYPIEHTNITLAGGGIHSVYMPRGNAVWNGLWTTDTAHVDFCNSCLNCLVHKTATNSPCLQIGDIGDAWQKQGHNVIISNNELNWCGDDGIMSKSGRLTLHDTSIYGAVDSCVRILNATYAIDFTGYNNTYDLCNTSSGADAGFYIQTRAGDIRLYNETFGAVSANDNANIMIYQAPYGNASMDRTRFVCDHCDFGTVVNPSAWISAGYVNLPLSGSPANTGPLNFGSDTYYTLHAVNKVAGVHQGWGPQGIYISKDATYFVDNTLNLRVKPWSPQDYQEVPLGDTYVAAGKTVTVVLQVRKSESAQFPPRLSMDGVGFHKDVDFDQMTDGVNVFEELTLSGVASTSGTLKIYLDVRGNYDPGSTSLGVYPPTLEIWADGYSVTITD